MPRLIDADALIDQLTRFQRKLHDADRELTANQCIAFVENAPTVDAVKVVRCGECSHSEVCKMDDGDVRYCHIFEMQTEDDYYCADGDRKDDGND